MNRKFEELNHGIAVQVVAQKIADGRIDPLADFVLLVTEFRDAVLKLAEDFGEKAKAPTKPKKAPRKAAEPKATTGGKRSGIEPEAIKAFIGKSQEGAASLQQIADNFKVSKGVAQRALGALGSAVKSATGPAVAGKRGKAPTVFWIE